MPLQHIQFKVCSCSCFCGSSQQFFSIFIRRFILLFIDDVKGKHVLSILLGLQKQCQIGHRCHSSLIAQRQQDFFLILCFITHTVLTFCISNVFTTFL